MRNTTEGGFNMKWIAIMSVALFTLGCAQFKNTVGSYAGMDIEVGYLHNFVTNDFEGGKKEGFFFPSGSERDENRIDGRIRLLFRPEQ